MLQDQQGRPSGQVGFIDFGIVGRVTPVTWTALEALLTATATRDFDTMARALATVGATDTDVDVKVLPALYPWAALAALPVQALRPCFIRGMPALRSPNWR